MFLRETYFILLIGENVFLCWAVTPKFLIAQLLDVQVFDKLRKKKWFIAPLVSSCIGSTVDTLLFFSISFYGTGVPWITLSLGDLAVKIIVALVMLIPFRLLLGTFKAA